MTWRRKFSGIALALLVGTTLALTSWAAPRVVLFEESTNYDCPPCFTANPIIHDVLEDFGDQVAAVKWHVWWPGPDDPFYTHNPSPVHQRISYYTINAAPDVVVDGQNGPDPHSYASMAAWINNRLAIQSPVSLEIEGEIVGGGVAGTAMISVDVTVETPQAAADHRLFCELVEEHIFMPSPNGETDHYDVFRRANAGNNATGESIDLTSAGLQHFDFELPVHDSYDVLTLGARVWIQNYSNRALIQAGKAHLLVPYYVGFEHTNPDIQIGGASEVMHYAGEMTNLGSQDDTYDLSVTGVPSGWTYTYSTPAGTFSGPSSLALLSGETAEVTLDIDSQGNSGSATVTLEAQSQGSAPNSASFEVRKLNSLQVLLVDDDAGDRQAVYEASLANVTSNWATWNLANMGPLSGQDLTNAARSVLWFTGTDIPTFTAVDRAAITDFINGGGNLFASGPDIGYDLADPASPNYTPDTQAWYESTLHATYETSFVFSLTIDGVAGDPISDGFDNIVLSNSPHVPGLIDGIAPGPGAEVSFLFDNQPYDAGVRHESGGSKVVYFSFGFENLPEAGIRDTVMERLLVYFGGVTGIPEPERAAPAVALAQNAPNPFRPATTISYTLGEAGPVSLRIYDVSGRMVRELVSRVQTATGHQVTWDGRDGAGRVVPGGVYFYRLEAPGMVETRRMVKVD